MRLKNIALIDYWFSNETSREYQFNFFQDEYGASVENCVTASTEFIGFEWDWMSILPLEYSPIANYITRLNYITNKRLHHQLRSHKRMLAVGCHVYISQILLSMHLHSYTT